MIIDSFDGVDLIIASILKTGAKGCLITIQVNGITLYGFQEYYINTKELNMIPQGIH